MNHFLSKSSYPPPLPLHHVIYVDVKLTAHLIRQTSVHGTVTSYGRLKTGEARCGLLFVSSHSSGYLRLKLLVSCSHMFIVCLWVCAYEANTISTVSN